MTARANGAKKKNQKRERIFTCLQYTFDILKSQKLDKTISTSSALYCQHHCVSGLFSQLKKVLQTFKKAFFSEEWVKLFYYNNFFFNCFICLWAWFSWFSSNTLPEIASKENDEVVVVIATVRVSSGSLSEADTVYIRVFAVVLSGKVTVWPRLEKVGVLPN